MLELRPICENCAKDLPNDSNEAMICSFECTYCVDCVNNILENVCPNCGGGFEKRPTRPSMSCSVSGNAPQTLRVFNPVDMEKFKIIHSQYKDIDPRKR